MTMTETCLYCHEPILEGEPTRAAVASGRFHRECFVRAVIGSAAHQLHECSCFGGGRHDPAGMTLRQAAVLAYEAFVMLQEKDGA